MMHKVDLAIVRLRLVYGSVKQNLRSARAQYFDPAIVSEYFETYGQLVTAVKEAAPELFRDLQNRPIPQPSDTTDFEGRGYIRRHHLERLLEDLEYIAEVWSRSQPQPHVRNAERRVFISHGNAVDRREVQAFIEKDLGVETLELAQQPNRGRTVLQKLSEESDHCSYAVIVMTGEDKMESGQVRTRENVMHEVGYFQGKFGLAKRPFVV